MSTVSQPKYRLGVELTKMLIERMDDPNEMGIRAPSRSTPFLYSIPSSSYGNRRIAVVRKSP